jgi:hypothetical protein
LKKGLCYNSFCNETPNGLIKLRNGGRKDPLNYEVLRRVHKQSSVKPYSQGYPDFRKLPL